MSVDLEAIAQRGHCDVSSLRLALPLLEQGYTPPYLARYRRDELGGLDESSLWFLASGLQTERQIAQRRDELHEVWQQTSLSDPAIGHAIKKSNSLRMLARLSRRLKAESHDSASDSTRLAVRLLNPQKGDGSDFAAIAAKVDGIDDGEAAIANVDQALAKRLAGDPRIIGAAVRWLVKHAKIHIQSIRDPHIGGDSAQASKPSGKDTAKPSGKDTAKPSGTEDKAKASDEKDQQGAAEKSSAPPADSPAASDPPSSGVNTSTPDSTEKPTGGETGPSDSLVPGDTPTSEAHSPTALAASSDASDSTGGDKSAGLSESVSADPSNTSAATPPAEPPSNSEPAASADATATCEASADATSSEATPDDATSADGAVANENSGTTSPPKGDSVKPSGNRGKTKEKQKKISPRQRRRRWLVSVLKPLEGKRLHCDKLSSFQVVMLGRALRSQVAVCSFEYDATKLVAELQRTAAGINRHLDQQLRDVVLAHEAEIREAAEAAWWDDLHERASSRLVSVAADHLRRHVNRGGVDARVVMAIDAIGPRTVATSIVASDGRLLHREDLPCQLSAAQRSQTVTRMGELIHTHHVDLIIISNGPARRASLVALHDLISQSPDKSVRWTIADRSGADAYAGSPVANEEMRATPRRFRAAAWLAFSVLQPAQAFAKVDPLKLRLSSFQRELADDALLESLDNVLVSGASRGGVDVNSAPVSWLARLPGVNDAVAQAIDSARRESLFSSRQSVSELDQWDDVVHSRQALPFLRVFGSEEVLDGTLIHPEDYPLAKKLASALEIELPPASPPGYVPPDYSIDHQPAEPAKLVEATAEPPTPEVEDFTAAAQHSQEFKLDADAGKESPPASESDASAPQPDASQPAASEPDSGSPDDVPAATGDAVETSHDEAQLDGDAVISGEPAETTETSSISDEPQPTSQSDESTAEPSSDPAAAESAPDTQGGEPGAQGGEPGTQGGEPGAQGGEPGAQSGERGAQSVAQDGPDSPAPVDHNIPEPIKRPRPEKSKVEKCIKEWQIGSRRAHQLVSWLCEPFGDSDSTENPPAVLTTIPSIKNLKPGEQVIGVVVGVMPFGVFVELAPDCSGLIHVSRISDSYVDDLHEAVQVGDVVTAWVTGIDDKRRRVALSAISPSREAELEEARRRRDTQSHRGGPRQRGGDRGSARPARGPGQSAQPTGARSGGGKPTGNRGAGRGGDQASGGGQSRGGGQARGGGRRDSSRGGGRSRSGGGSRSRDKKPESYRVVGKKETKPISDAMQKGEEPLRSFGDLMQFFDKGKETESPEKAPPSTAQSAPDTPAPTAPDAAAPDAAGSEDGVKQGPPAGNEDPDAGSDRNTAAAQGESSDEARADSPQQSKDAKHAGSDSDDSSSQPPPNQSSPADAPTS